MMKFFIYIISLVSFIAIQASIFPPSAQALPKNFRDVDVFWVGAMPTEKDIDEMAAMGIDTIISLHRLPPEVIKKAQKNNITLHSFPWRTRLVNVDQIMEIIKKARIGSIYIHCLHGADRTGAVTAYWLTKSRNINPFEALAMVMSPKDFHVKGLEMLTKEYAVCMPPVDPDIIGIYSGARNGGLEGLKICGGEWYTRLARNYLIATMGMPVNKPVEKFWSKWEKKKKKKLAPKDKS